MDRLIENMGTGAEFDEKHSNFTTSAASLRNCPLFGQAVANFFSKGVMVNGLKIWAIP